jgi:hypothetical protein
VLQQAVPIAKCNPPDEILAGQGQELPNTAIPVKITMFSANQLSVAKLINPFKRLT